MRRPCALAPSMLCLAGVFTTLAVVTPVARAACCYFAAKEQDVQQPAQKAFITWDPRRQLESFTVQPRFSGKASEFGMVVPTPSKPELHEMPRDFFKSLAVFTILKQRKHAESKLVSPFGGFGGNFGGALGGGFGFGGGGMGVVPPKPTVKVIEAGVVGSLDYKIITAERAGDLYRWLKDHQYHYAGDEATLDSYVRKKWFFTVMRIDPLQMRRGPDGSYTGEVTPTRFQFQSDTLVYPLRITRISVRDRTEALLYVQAPFKADLPGDFTFQYQWHPLLQSARSMTEPNERLPGKGDDWLRLTRSQQANLRGRADELGFRFVSGKRAEPNEGGQTPTTLEWAKRLTARDILVLRGEAPFSEKVPDVDVGFTANDLRDRRKGTAARQTILRRVEQSRRERPSGYLVREAPTEDIQGLRELVGHLQEGQFLTKLRKTFTRDEMNEDLVLAPAELGPAVDQSEYEVVLPASPP